MQPSLIIRTKIFWTLNVQRSERSRRCLMQNMLQAFIFSPKTSRFQKRSWENMCELKANYLRISSRVRRRCVCQMGSNPSSVLAAGRHENCNLRSCSIFLDEGRGQRTHVVSIHCRTVSCSAVRTLGVDTQPET